MSLVGGYTSIEQIQGQYLASKNTDVIKKESSQGFADILKEKSIESNERLKFSKHADERLATRNISLTREQVERLSEGTRKAEEKGINESLMLMDGLAFIVNVKNSTVVTAMDSSNTNERIFTNIDGAVIV